MSRSITLLALLWLPSLLAAKDKQPTVLAHYMPWYQTKAVSGQWGWHWTMDNFDPDQIKWEGQRRAASHEYPLIGLYDSGDDHALECQALLMKFAGLDGAVIDWYGTKDALDYAANHAHTEKFIGWLKKAGLCFAICYEDQAITQMIKVKALGADDALKQGATDLQWAEQHWFNDESYVKQEGRPTLLVFGPQQFKREAWTALRSSLASKPLIYGLPHLAKDHGMDGAFGWPPVKGGRSSTPEAWHKELDALYARPTPVIATVFPGFKDIYKQAGVHDSYGSIGDRDGETFAESLEMAMKSKAALVQVATWNDYGEGTVVEPTRSHGYRYLEMLQKARGTPPRYSAADLRLPVMLYQLRKRTTGDEVLAKELNNAAALLFDSQCLEAEALLAKVSSALGRRAAIFAESPAQSDPNYHLVTEILYREGKDVTDAMQQRCRLDLYLPANKATFSTIVWFHGGGLTKGERSIPMPLRNQGVGVVAVDYRLSPFHHSPAFIEDAAAAVAWVFKHIASYGGSADRIFVSGHSAGAYLTSMIGLDKNWLAAHDIDANRIAGLIPLSPQSITHYAIRDERGIDEKQPVVDAFAPLFHVRKDASPILIVTGDREKEMLGRYEESAYFWRMLKVAGHKDATLRELDGYDHGGMPEPAFPLVLKFMEEHSTTNDKH